MKLETKLRFWRWVHDRAEAFWHWVYYAKLQRLERHNNPSLWDKPDCADQGFYPDSFVYQPVIVTHDTFGHPVHAVFGLTGETELFHDGVTPP